MTFSQTQCGRQNFADDGNVIGIRFVVAYNFFGFVDNIWISRLTFSNFNIPPIEDDFSEDKDDGYANPFHSRTNMARKR